MRTAPGGHPNRMNPLFTHLRRLLAVVLASGVLAVPSLAAPSSAAPPPVEGRWTGITGETFQHVATESTPEVRNPTSLIQDHTGFLWIGSQDGLVRWDGYRFRLYRPDGARKGSLPDNDIRHLFVDAAGRLWIATNVGGLARYDGATDSFTTFTAGPKGLSHVTVTSVADDGRGGLWVGTWGGLDHLDPRTGIIRKAAIGGLPDIKTGALLRDRAGRLWIGTAGGLVRRVGTSLEKIVLPTADGTTPSIREIFQDAQGHVWVATRRHGAYVVDPGTLQIRAVGSGDLRAEGINTLIEVRPGEIWMGTFAHGIVAVDIATLRTRRIVHDPAVANSLLYDQVWSLYRDRSGLVWVATGEGISRYAPEQGAFSVLPGATGRPGDMSEAGALAIHEMADGRFWMGLTRKGVDIIDPVAGRVTTLAPDVKRPETALPQTYVWDFETVGTDVFIATAQGLYRTDQKGRGVARVHIPGRDPNAYTIDLMADGRRLWIAGYDGVWSFDPRRPQNPPSHITGLTDERARILMKDAVGNLWIGTENGLDRLAPDGRVERILPDRTDSHALSAGFISSLLIDRHGRLWVGTSGGGLDMLTGRDAGGRARFRHIGAAEGLPDPNVDKLLADRQGRIWVATDSGLAIVDPDSLSVRPISRESGLSILNYWVGSGTVTSAGELMFSGATGVLAVRPDMLKAWAYAPPLVISDMRVGKATKMAALFNEGRASGPLVVPPGKPVSVEFSALDFSAPERNRYRYRLDGFERDWNETDAGHRVATYTNLPPGRYTLRLQGSNRDGAWSGRTLDLSIHVLPAWFQTWWFYLSGALVAAVLILTVVQTRTGFLRNRQRQLEALIEERTSELRRSQAQLEQMAYFDSLTGLPNRRMFHEDFRKAIAWARREKSSFSLLLIDLDRFKQVNDTLGHDAGDALLQEAAIRLRAVLRENDCVARLGGDEFAILLMGGGQKVDIDTVCGRIVKSFAAPVRFQANSLWTSPSIGVAEYPTDGASEDELYKSADIALYVAKNAGRNTWRHYVPDSEDDRISVS